MTELVDSPTKLILNGDDGEGGTIDGDVYSDIIYAPHFYGFQLLYEFNKAGTGSEDLVATLELQVRTGPRSTIGADGDGWVPATDAAGVAVAFPSDPAGSLMRDEVTFTDAVGQQYRVFVDYTSGDGLGIIELVHLTRGRT